MRWQRCGACWPVLLCGKAHDRSHRYPPDDRHRHDRGGVAAALRGWWPRRRADRRVSQQPRHRQCPDPYNGDSRCCFLRHEPWPFRGCRTRSQGPIDPSKHRCAAAGRGAIRTAGSPWRTRRGRAQSTAERPTSSPSDRATASAAGAPVGAASAAVEVTNHQRQGRATGPSVFGSKDVLRAKTRRLGGMLGNTATSRVHPVLGSVSEMHQMRVSALGVSSNRINRARS